MSERAEPIAAVLAEVDAWVPMQSRDAGEVFSADSVTDLVADIRAALAAQEIAAVRDALDRIDAAVQTAMREVPSGTTFGGLLVATTNAYSDACRAESDRIQQESPAAVSSAATGLADPREASREQG